MKQIKLRVNNEFVNQINGLHVLISLRKSYIIEWRQVTVFFFFFFSSGGKMNKKEKGVKKRPI